MLPYKYLAMKFANQWATRERDIHANLSGRIVTGEAVATALHYFQVARTFKGLDDPNNRHFIAEQLVEHSRYLTSGTFSERVESLASAFEKHFKSRNVSAASKLLWLRKRSPVLVFDKWARDALQKMEDINIGNDYSKYASIWRKSFEEHSKQIRQSALSLTEVQEYSALWNTDQTEFADTVRSDWFAERVFDMGLLHYGKKLKQQTL